MDVPKLPPPLPFNINHMHGIVILLIALWVFSAPLVLASDNAEGVFDANKSPSRIATEFWLASNLGDLNAMAALLTESDAKLLPQPKGEAAEIMKMRKLPHVLPLREEISAAITKTFVFGEPEIDDGGKTAFVPLTVKIENIRHFCEAKEVYDVYMGKAFQETQAGRDPPDLESVRMSVLAPNSPHQKRITKRIEAMKSDKFPSAVHLIKTDNGWRIDLKQFLGSG